MGVRFYLDSWLTAAAGVGLLKVLEEKGIETHSLIKGRKLEIEEELWNELPSIFADKILEGSEEKLKEFLSEEKNKDKNPYNILVLPQLNDFFPNSPIVNQSKDYIKRLKGIHLKLGDLPEEEKIQKLKEEIRKALLEGLREFQSKESDPQAPLCFFCRERRSYFKNKKPRTFSAEHFMPLAASLETVSNFAWDGKGNLFICPECEFFLLFTPFSFTRSGKRFLLVYIPDDPQKMLSTNTALYRKGKLEKEILKDLFEVVKVLKEKERHVAEWTLKNIYFVEIEVAGTAKANIHSFSVSPKLAKVIKDRIDRYPDVLNPIFNLFLEYVYGERSLYELLMRILSGFFFKESYKKAGGAEGFGRGFKEFLPGGLLYLINFQEALEMEMGDFEKQVRWAYAEGLSIKEKMEKGLGKERAKSRIESLSHRLLDAIRRKDTDAFQQNLIRAYLQVEREIPYLFVEALSDKSFNRIAYAFLIGLNGRRKEGGEGEDNGTSEDSVG